MYEANDSDTKQVVALKELSKVHLEMDEVERFKREIQIQIKTSTLKYHPYT